MPRMEGGPCADRIHRDSDAALRDRAVADVNRRYFGVLSDLALQLDDVIVWVLFDRLDWLQYLDNANRADGFEVRGRGYGRDYQPKQMRTTCTAALNR